ncbi:MAG: T9SS type A sorting domain-containing protein [Sphingobacteriales bacterium]|nr:MAG: T9SS type A sorting domain-containing protein [Sphingobacteriales bacterium]
MKKFATKAILLLIAFLCCKTTVFAQCAVGTAYQYGSTLSPTTILVPVTQTGTWKQNIISVNVVAGNRYSIGNCNTVNGTNPSPAGGTSITVRDAISSSATIIAWIAGPSQQCVTFIAPTTGTVYAYFYDDNCNNETISFTCGAIWEGCVPPSSITASNVTPIAATLTWGPGATTSPVGYEYAITTSSTPPTPPTGLTATTSTTVNATGLLPTTTYYMHVRQDCGPPDGWSGFSTKSFTTPAIPPCKAPTNIKFSNLSTTAVDISWNTADNSASYDYMVDQTSGDPITVTGVTNTINTSANITGLTPGEKYFVHLRTDCTGFLTTSNQSDWALDSFETPVPCVSPKLKVDYINTDQAVVYWEPVRSATEYEYAITKSATPPAVGTVYNKTSLLISALNDGVTYYVHVRNHCNSLGILDTSPWASISFRTFPTGVQDINNLPFSINAYPNPMGNVLNVDIKGKISSSSKATIVDVTGKTLMIIAINDHQTSVDVSALPAGNYLLKYTDGTHNQSIKVTK